MFNWILDQLRKGYEKVVYSWNSFEFKSVRVIFSRVYIQLDARLIEKDCGKIVSYIRNLLIEGGN